MAVINPSIETIQSLRQKPTEGELHVLKFLKDNLDDTYEVYFQPFLNGDIPDIIIMRENSGLYILEVKDWDLELYSINERRHWFVQTSSGKRQPIKSPISQVFNYRENLYNLHIEGLLEKKIKNPKLLSIVNCGVYFHNASTKYCNDFVREKFDIDQTKPERRNRNLKFLSYFDLIGFDSLKPDPFQKIMNKRWMSKKSYLFDNELYKSFKRHLMPPRHYKDQGIPITYSEEQKKIIDSGEKSKQKVKGVAGSGKTLCLAKRVVNAYERHEENVLILTFNIALRNYIHDKINEVREDFEWKNFHIVHYHEFFKNQANNYNLPLQSLDDWHNQRFFENIKEQIVPYKTIVIDEVQDYNRPWIELINNYFLDKNEGEYVAYGDEKQNIYQREYDQKEKKPYTKIGGQWNLLKRSYRVTNDIARLAEVFQRTFFSTKYELDEIQIQKDLFEQSEMRYVLTESFDPNEIIKLYQNIADEITIHDNDICFQATQVRPLRQIDFQIRTRFKQKTNTMFETQEVYDKLLEDQGLVETDVQRARHLLRQHKRGNSPTKKDLEIIEKYQKFKKDIEKVRRNKKFNYWNNRGLLKFSTIHSFKGWEVDTLFLIISNEDKEDDEEEFTTEELIYTAITRCRANLIIFNINNNHYHEFFEKNIKKMRMPSN